MPKPSGLTVTITLSEKLAAAVQALIPDGPCDSVEEVVYAAVEVFVQRHAEEPPFQRMTEKEFDAAIAHGLASGIAPPGTFDRVRAKLDEYVREREDAAKLAALRRKIDHARAQIRRGEVVEVSGEDLRKRFGLISG